MSERSGARRPDPPDRPLFRDEEPAQPVADEQATAVYPRHEEPRPFPPLQHESPLHRESSAPYGRMAPVGRAPQRDAYPPQPPARQPPATAAPPPAAPGGFGGALPRTRRRRFRFGRRRALAIAAVLFLVLPLGLYFFADSRLDRVDAFPAASTRPADTPGTNWLIVGSDSREGLSKSERRELATGGATGQRTDTIMLLHLSESGGPTLVSIPRDSYVPIPGHSDNRINAAFAFGGPALLIRTLEAQTGIRIDHYAEIGFNGLFDVVNAVGGVDMCIDAARKDPKAGLDIAKGCQNLDGGEALGIARSRASTRGDLDRVESQRELIAALMDKATSPSTLLNPWRAFSLARSGPDALTVHDGDHVIDLARLAWAMRSLGSEGTTTTVPIGATPNIAGVGFVVTWHADRAETMFAALREDRQVPKSVQR